MSGPTRRDLENRVDNLSNQLGGDEEILIARCDPVTGDLEDLDGNPIDSDGHGADELVIFEEVLVLEREKAEKEDRTILGPYQGGPVDRDLVEVLDE